LLQYAGNPPFCKCFFYIGHMSNSKILNLLSRYKKGEIPLKRIKDEISKDFIEDLGFAHVDHLREHKKKFPEVIYGEGKTSDQIVAIAHKILAHSGRLLVTRVEKGVFYRLKKDYKFLKFNELARCIYFGGDSADKKKFQLKKGHILVVCAGTSDLPVAEEAAITAKVTGCRVRTLFDVGVAGIHRVLYKSKEIEKASVIICVAGMEGALASVVGGLASCPVIAVPTSVGYGASFNGVAALLAMLNSCASGVTVVNIDNGFGAGFSAYQMLKMKQK